MRRPSTDSLVPPLALGAAGIMLPAALLGFMARDQVEIDGWIHFVGLGFSALAAAGAVLALTIVGARRNDGRTALVLDHHERLAGDEYPRGLENEELHLDTRILTVCDVYDALISPRVYRPTWTHERAMGLLREETGPAFDQRCVEALERVLAREQAEALAIAVQRLSYLGPSGTNAASSPRARNHSTIASWGGFSMP